MKPATRIFLVAYTDDDGPYAVAFSRREYAEAFAHEMCRADRRVTTMIETEIDSPGAMITASDGMEG